MDRIDAATVLALARKQGQDWIDESVAGRIATGAAAAVEAVVAELDATGDGVLTEDPEAFLAVLESLAEPR